MSDYRIGDKIRLTRTEVFEGYVTGIGQGHVFIDGTQRFIDDWPAPGYVSVEILERAKSKIEVGDVARSGDAKYVNLGPDLWYHENDGQIYRGFGDAWLKRCTITKPRVNDDKSIL